MKQASIVRTRIAPSPTGVAHVGTAYMALFNYAFARKNKGQFILRLEDTDVKRNVPAAEDAIYAGLSWLGIEWDEGPDLPAGRQVKGGQYGPYRQSERLEVYKKYAGQLVKDGKVYEEEGAIRFKNPGEDIKWHDLVRGDVSFPGGEVKDFVVIKGDGYPTYNFAVVVDDIEMEISHVIRGEEHISNTPRQLALYKAFGVQPPEFAHLPTLRAPDRKKLSKRRDPVSLRFFREEGYLPQALVNFLCLLGWSHPEEKEIFGMEEFIDKFTLKRVRRAGPVFDWKKLEWINGMYIRNMKNSDLAHLINEHIAASVPMTLVEKIAPLAKERIAKFSDVEPLLEFFWKEPVIDKGSFEDTKAPVHVAAALHALGSVKKWTLPEINKALEAEIQEKGLKTGEFYMTMRIALTRKKITPPINESMVILGQDKVLHRLEDAQKILLVTNH